MRYIWSIYLVEFNRKVCSELQPDIVGITGYGFLAPKIIKYNCVLNAVCKALLMSFADGFFLYLKNKQIVNCRGPPLINLKQKQIDRREYNDCNNQKMERR